MEKLYVVGLGYIGFPTAAMFANHGWQVHGLDLNQKAVDMIYDGRIHIQEVVLNEIVATTVENGSLKASTGVKEADCFIFDALEVINLANQHPRMNLHLPGPEVNGYCLAVDPYFIIEKAPEEAQLIANERAINNSMPDFVVQQVRKRVRDKDSKIAVLGLTYKGNIDDVRESPAMEIVSKLLEEGYTLGVHDPHIRQEQVEFEISTFEEAVVNAECILVLTDHNEFKELDEEVILTETKQPLVLDNRNCVRVLNKEIEYVNFANIGIRRMDSKVDLRF